jgi:HK97 gp10 family phage protein
MAGAQGGEGNGMRVKIRTLGAEQIAINLRKYGDKGDDILKNALHAGAKIVREEMENQAPTGKTYHYQVWGMATKKRWVPLSKVRRPGNLKRSIIIQKVKPENLTNESVSFRVGPNPGGFYGYFLEFGLGYLKGAINFVSRAFDYSQEKAMQAIANSAKQAMEKL